MDEYDPDHEWDVLVDMVMSHLVMMEKGARTVRETGKALRELFRAYVDRRLAWERLDGGKYGADGL